MSSGTTYYLRVTVEDEAGNTTTSDVLKPENLETPSIEITSGKRNNDSGWYLSDVEVTITDNSSSTTGHFIKYYITGAQVTSTTNLALSGSTGIVTIDTDGTSAITAWIVDSYGNKSDSVSITVQKEETCEYEVGVATYSDTSITFYVNAENCLSGFKQTAQIMLIGNSTTTTTFTTSGSISADGYYELTFTDLEPSTEYTLYYVVTDNAASPGQYNEGSRMYTEYYCTQKTSGTLYYWDRYTAIGTTNWVLNSYYATVCSVGYSSGGYPVWYADLITNSMSYFTCNIGCGDFRAFRERGTRLEFGYDVAS